MAGQLEADLSATLPGSWTCEVRPDYVLVVRSSHATEEVALDPELDEVAWPAEAFLAQISGLHAGRRCQ
jgi:hypothetical protein